MTHELKILPTYFEDVLMKLKTFELRKNDRNFNVGDILVLNEYIPDIDIYTQRRIICEVTYILNGPLFGLSEGYCIMSIEFLSLISS